MALSSPRLKFPFSIAGQFGFTPTPAINSTGSGHLSKSKITPHEFQFLQDFACTPSGISTTQHHQEFGVGDFSRKLSVLKMSTHPVSVAEMQEADRTAIHALGLPGCVLMYNAGKSVADLILEKYPSKRVLILAGRGNNGGDGFVVAHILYTKGMDVSLISLAEPEGYSEDATIFLKLCQKEGINISFDKENCARIVANAKDVIIVDALLGTGTKGEVREPYASVIRAIPADVPVVAVDLPSGMNGDTGEICGVAIHANHTVTFAAPKHGLIGHEDLTGELHIADIGMPLGCLPPTQS